MLGSSLISYKQVTRKKKPYIKRRGWEPSTRNTKQIKVRKHMSWKNINNKDNPNKNKTVNKKKPLSPTN
jgi:hypothetical protein